MAPALLLAARALAHSGGDLVSQEVQLPGDHAVAIEADYGVLWSPDGGAYRWLCHEAITAPNAILTPLYGVWDDGRMLGAVPTPGLGREPDEPLYWSADGCGWELSAGATGLTVSSLAVGGAAKALVATADLSEGASNGIYRSLDGGASFAPTDLVRAERLFRSVAFGADQTAWATAVWYTTNEAWLYHSTDGGQTWTEHAVPLPRTGDAHHVDLVAASPLTPLTAWIAVGPAGGDRLLRTVDGGETFQEVYATSANGDIVDGGIAPDGTLWVALTEWRVIGSADGITFTEAPSPPMAWGVGAGRGKGWLAAVGLIEGYAAYTSPDPLTPFAPLLHLSELQPPECPVGSSVEQRCMPLWPTLQARLPFPPGHVDDLSGDTADEVHPPDEAPPPARSGCGGCSSGASPPSGWALAAAAVLIIRRRSWLAVTLGACRAETPTGLDDQALLDPASCEGCHPDHHRSWSGSMHAYASVDPVFRAMNARGQRETGGELGDLCVRCHAPLALAVGATVDGTNLDEVGNELQGVGCAACHLVTAVSGRTNGALELTRDGVVRAGVRDPIHTSAHDSEYSPLHDRSDLGSSDLCGACHDVELPNGLLLEGTWRQWRGSTYAEGVAGLSCAECHLPGQDGPIAVGGPERRRHDHAMPAVDLAFTPFPERDLQRAAVQDLLDETLLSELCVRPIAAGSEISLRLENLAAGHAFPSGASHDRRVWVELVAEGDEGEILLDLAVGEEPWELHDRVSGSDGRPALHFWEIEALEERALPAPFPVPAGGGPARPHAVERRWPLAGVVPQRVTARVYLVPIGRDVLEDLVASGDLDPAIAEEMPTFELGGAARTWTGPLGSCAQPAR